MKLPIITNCLNYGIQFKSTRYSDYLDDVEAVYNDEIIPKYEDMESYNSEIISSSFRDDELWDRKRDTWGDTDRAYDQNDVQLANDRTYMIMNSNDRNITSRYIEVPDFYSEEYVDYKPQRNCIYTSDCAHKKKHESIQERLNQGFCKDDIKKIYHSSLMNKINNKIMDFDLAEKGFNLLKTQTPVEDVIKIMEGSKLCSCTDYQRFNQSLFDFLTVFPNGRSIVVQNDGGYEYIRKDILSSYEKISKSCSNTEDIKHVVKASELKKDDRTYLDNNLLEICIDKIEEGYSPIFVSKNMNKSKIDIDKKNVSFNKDLFDFFMEYPIEKSKVVGIKGTKDFVRNDIIKVYPLIDETCKHNQQKIDKVIKLCELGGRINKEIDEECLNACIEEINAGRSIFDIEEDIQYSKIHKLHGIYFDREFYDFLKKYPEGREVVIDKSFRNEELRRDKMNAYPEIADLCNDVDDIAAVLKDCTVINHKNKSVNRMLLDFAKDLLKKDNYWRKEHKNIINSVKVVTSNNYTLIDEEKISRASDLLKDTDATIEDVHLFLSTER